MTKEEKEAWRRALAQLGKELFPEGNPVRKANMNTRPRTEREIQDIRDSQVPLKEDLAEAQERYKYWYMATGPSLCGGLLKEVRRIEGQTK